MRLFILSLNLICLNLIGLSLFGCGTITGRGWHQVVLIKSQPNGMTIVSDGKALGVTPKYVEIKRSAWPKITLQDPDSTANKTLTLDTRYRWGRSFFGNFAFLTYAPVGWITDFISGASWQIQAPQTIPLEGATPKTENAEPKSIAIAPPAATTLALSDQGGEYFEKLLKQKYPKMSVMNFEASIEGFAGNQYDFDSKPDAQAQPDLYYDVGADYVFESSIVQTPGHLKMTGQLRDTITEKTVDTPLEVSLRSTDLTTENELSWHHKLDPYFHLFPNTVALDFSNSSTSLQVDANTAKAENAPNDSFWVKSASYVSMIGISHLSRPRAERSGYFKFQFIPGGSFSHRELYFPQLPLLSQYRFTRTYAMLGAGPEIGWQSGNNYIYLNLIFMLTYGKIYWQENSSDRFESRVGAASRVELGYLRFFSQNFNFRIFTRTTSEDASLWQDTFKRVLQREVAVANVATNFVGFSIGYYFLPNKRYF